MPFVIYELIVEFDRLQPLVRGDDLPLILLNDKQPDEIISQALRLLVTAATRMLLKEEDFQNS